MWILEEKLSIKLGLFIGWCLFLVLSTTMILFTLERIAPNAIANIGYRVGKLENERVAPSTIENIQNRLAILEGNRVAPSTIEDIQLRLQRLEKDAAKRRR